MSIADKLVYLDDTKTLLREAIRRAGHHLPDSATYRSYPYAMLPDEASQNLDFVRGEYIAKNWRDGTVSRVGLSNIMTTTRASGGGYFDHLGVYQWAANNAPRIDHDPATLSTSTSSIALGAGIKTFAVSRLYPVGQYVRATADASNWLSGRVVASTGTSVTLWVDRVVGSGTHASWTVIRVRGVLVEESRTNITWPSADMSNNVRWIVDGGTRPTVNSYRETATNEAHRVYANTGGASGTVMTSTVWFKPVNRRYFALRQPGGLGFVGFDTQTLTISYLPSGFSGSIRGFADGTVELSITCTAAGPVGSHLMISDQPLTTSTLPSYAGATNCGFDDFRAQLEVGAFPTSYIPTTSAQVTRAADQCSIANLTDWLGTDRTIIIEHNAPSGRVLLSSGSTVLATSQGPGKLAIAYTASETRICQAGGSVTTSGPLTFDTSLRLLASATAYANAHVSVVQSIPRALTNTELQRITA